MLLADAAAEGGRKKKKKKKEGEERERKKKQPQTDGSETVRGVREGVHTLSGEPGTPSGPLAACQYYEHGGAR